MDLFSDDELMNYLFKNYFDDITSDLENIYDNAYNDAYTEELYNKVWTELKGTFIDQDAQVIWIQGSNNKYIPRLKITKVLRNLIHEYLSINCYTNIFDIGGYSYFITELFDCGIRNPLNFRVPDYPHPTLVKQKMNELLIQYI